MPVTPSAAPVWKNTLLRGEKISFSRKVDRDLASRMQHKSHQPLRVLQFHSVLTGTLSFAGFAQHHLLKPV